MMLTLPLEIRRYCLQAVVPVSWKRKEDWIRLLAVFQKFLRRSVENDKFGLR